MQSQLDVNKATEKKRTAEWGQSCLRCDSMPFYPFTGDLGRMFCLLRGLCPPVQIAEIWAPVFCFKKR